jgi:hypothetical protein
MLSNFFHSCAARVLVGAAVVLLAAGAAGAQGYVEFRPVAATGATTAVRLLPVDATATVSAYGYAPAGGGQFLYVGLVITNTGALPLTVAPASCAYTDDAGHRTSGASLFSGNSPLVSATVAAGGRDDLQLGFAVPDGAALADARGLTVDVAFTCGGRPYTIQVPFTKAPAAIAGPPAAPSPAPVVPTAAAPTAALPGLMPVAPGTYPLTPAAAAVSGLPWGTYTTPYAGSGTMMWAGFNGLVWVPSTSYVYGSFWDASTWGGTGWVIYINSNDGYLYHHRRHHDDGDSSTATGVPTTASSVRPGWTAVSPSPVVPTSASPVNVVARPPRNPSTSLPASGVPRTVPATESRAPILVPAPSSAAYRQSVRYLPPATPSLPNPVPTLPNAVPTLPNPVPRLPNAVPSLPSVRVPSGVSSLPTLPDSPAGPVHSQP